MTTIGWVALGAASLGAFYLLTAKGVIGELANASPIVTNHGTGTTVVASTPAVGSPAWTASQVPGGVRDHTDNGMTGSTSHADIYPDQISPGGNTL